MKPILERLKWLTETTLGTSEVTYIHKKQSGGAGQFAKVTLSVEPLEPGKVEK